MPHNHLRALAVFVAALFGGCSSYSTTFDWDQHFDFAKLSTWSWEPTEPGGAPNDLTKQRVMRSIEAVLAARGYRMADAAPDFRVSWAVRSQEKLRATESAGYRDPYHDHWTGYYGPRTVDITSYEEGSLIVDVIDPTEDRLVWRGTATRVIDRSWTPSKADEVVREAVDKIIANFPPGR